MVSQWHKKLFAWVSHDLLCSLLILHLFSGMSKVVLLSQELQLAFKAHLFTNSYGVFECLATAW